MDPSITDPGIVVWSQPEPETETEPATYMDQIGNLSHPPYPEMITAAITALGEPAGSSRQAIAKYIEQSYANLPENNAVLLTRYLKQLKQTGQLETVKHSYLLPGSVPDFTRSEQPPAGNEAYVVVAADSASGMKRRPGRPPKLRTTGNQITVPATVDVPIPVEESVFVSLGLVDEPAPPPAAPTLGKRGRGRPPKSQSAIIPVVQNETVPVEIFPVSENGPRRGPGRPRKIGFIGTSSPSSHALRLRGIKPRKVAKPSGRPRGRPRKYAIMPAMEDGGTSDQMIGDEITPTNRRGRLPMAGIMLKKTRRSLSGKPLGRPRKNVANQQTQQAHGDIVKKLEHIQLKVKEVIDIVKPHLNPITASIAIGALQELEQSTLFNSSFLQQQQRAVPTVTTTHIVSAQSSPGLTTTTHLVSVLPNPVFTATTTTTGQEQTHFPTHFPITTASFSSNNNTAAPSHFPVYPSQFQASYPTQGPIH